MGCDMYILEGVPQNRYETHVYFDIYHHAHKFPLDLLEMNFSIGRLSIWVTIVGSNH